MASTTYTPSFEQPQNNSVTPMAHLKKKPQTRFSGLSLSSGCSDYLSPYTFHQVVEQKLMKTHLLLRCYRKRTCIFGTEFSVYPDYRRSSGLSMIIIYKTYVDRRVSRATVEKKRKKKRSRASDDEMCCG